MANPSYYLASHYKQLKELQRIATVSNVILKLRAFSALPSPQIDILTNELDPFWGRQVKHSANISDDRGRTTFPPATVAIAD